MNKNATVLRQVMKSMRGNQSLLMNMKYVQMKSKDPESKQVRLTVTEVLYFEGASSVAQTYATVCFN